MNDEAAAPGIAGGTVQIVAGAPVQLAAGNAINLAAGDNQLDFVSPINSLRIQNNTANPIKIEYDAGATAGSWVIAANGGEFADTCLLRSLHIFATAVAVVNGAAASGIIIHGRA